MRGRVAAAVLLSLSFSSSAIPQCIPARASFPFRSTVFDLAIDGNDLWVASGYGVELLDRVIDPPMPRLATPLPGTTRVVRVSRGVVYAASDDRLFVVQRVANAPQIVRSITARGTINDLAAGTHLYLATSKGIEQFDLVDPLAPRATTSSFATSSENVQSLTISGSSLYAADGDSTVEVFSIAAPTAPVRTASLQTLPRAIAVHVARDRVYVSDGQNTEVFLGQSTTASARFAYGSTSFATISADEHFVAGTDRAVRAVDFALASRPVELFEHQLPPHGGTSNRVFAMQRAGDRLYVAAGDIGLVSFDTSGFGRPYTLASYRTGAMSSVVVSGSRAFVAAPASRVTELTVNPGGISLDVGTTRSETVDAVHDANASSIVVSRGSNLWIEPLTGATGTPRMTSLPSPVRSAAFAGPVVLAHLDNGNVMSVDVATGTALQLNLGGLKPSLIGTDGGSTVVLAIVGDDGNTELKIYGADLTAPRLSVAVPGGASGSVAVGAASAAVFTYRGINLVDLTTGAVSLLPSSDRQVATRLHFTGTELLEITDRSLLVWDTARMRLEREITLPSEPVAIDTANGIAVIATSDGVTAVRYAELHLPAATTPRNANRYYSRIAAAAGRLYLADDDGVDVYSTAFDYTPHHVGTVATSGLAAIAAADGALFTLSTSGVVRAYTADGVLLRERSIHDGSADWQPLAMFAVGGAPWIAYSRGCSTTDCQQSTAVLDPQSLAITSTLTGAAVDVTATATRTAALFTSPNELRTYDLSDRTRPLLLASVDKAPEWKALAARQGMLYLLGPRIETYDERQLTVMIGNLVDVVRPEAWQEQLRVVGDCALLLGRRTKVETRPVLFGEIGGPPLVIELPSIVRGSAVSGGRVFVLTDHSVEVLDSSPATPLPKRRAVR